MPTEWIDRVIREIAEMDDRSSPPDWPEAMLITPTEIREIISRHFAASMSSAARDVLTERRRQIDAKGWTPEHDDQYKDGELADAAASYALSANATGGLRPTYWPWGKEWWKPTNPRRDLIKAAALAIAAIERLDRAEARKNSWKPCGRCGTKEYCRTYGCDESAAML